MNVLLASSEVHPYSKTGGLADMVGALARTLARAGHRVGVVTPLYQDIRTRFPELRPANVRLDLPLGTRTVSGEIFALEPFSGLTVYFVEQPGFFDRPGLYQQDGADYPDNAERFIFFAKAIAHLARVLPWRPEMVHVHDWQAALVPLLMQHERLSAGWGNAPRTCMTIHNLAYQGVFPKAQYPLTNLPWEYFHPNGLEFHDYMNCLKGGIAYSDIVTTVSPRYAREITTAEFGCGLDGLLRQRQYALFGILNGVDYEEWSTARNPYLKHPYSADDLSGKAANKAELQAEVGLPVEPGIPLFGSIGRLVEQKGVDIQLGALEEMLAGNLQFVLLGSGAPAFEKAYLEIARRHPTKVAVRIGFNQALSHRIEAGADFFLMPSKFEPCGLNQLYSLRYGTIPIVRSTGGLDDTVIDVSEGVERANGIKFSEYSSRALAKAIQKALALYHEPELLNEFRLNAMTADFSEDRTAEEYLTVYHRAGA